MLLEEARGLLDGGTLHLAGKGLHKQRVGEDGGRGLLARAVVVEEEFVIGRG